MGSGMSERRKAVAALLGAALLWSLGGVLIKWVDWHPMAIMGARSLIATGLTYALLRGKVRRIGRVELAAALAYAVTVAMYVSAVKLTTAANAILLQYTAPVWIALAGGWALGERTTRGDWVVLAVALLGMLLFFRQGLRAEGFVGNLLAALSGVTYAATMVLLRKQRDADPLSAILLGNVVAALIGLPFAIGQPLPSAQGWLGLALLGIVQQGLSYGLYSYAIRHVTALESALILTIEPILNPIWVALAIGEYPDAGALAGGALVVAAVTARAVASARRRMRGPRAA
jgi:drug/metabolite transporter (DMT)-like permease